MIQLMNHRYRLTLLRPYLTGTLSIGLGINIMMGVSGLSAQAQTIPAQVDPGRVSSPELEKIDTEQQSHKNKQGVDAQKQIPATTEETKINVPEQEKSAASGKSTKFLVSKITVEGNTSFSDEELNAIISKYEGQNLSLDDLGTVVDDINRLYRDKGLLTAQAFLPPQDVDNGQVKIQILEGTIGHIDISGNKFFRTSAIKRNISYKEGDSLNIPELERTISRINNQDNFRLKAILKAGEKTGQSDITFQVAERQPWQISPTFDNQGRPFVGSYRWGVEVGNNNVSGFGDRLLLKWLMASRTQVAGASYFIPLNRFGTELGYSYSFSYVDIDLHSGPQPRIQGFAQNHSIVLSQPLDRDRHFVADASMNFRNVTTDFNHIQQANPDEVRSFTTGLSYNELDRWGRTFARVQSDVGFAAMGGNRQFWKGQVYGTRLHRLPFNSMLILRTSAQFTPDALPSIEQYQIGGAFSVRGFSEGLVSGDNGYNFGAEIRYPIPGLKFVSPWLADRLQGAYFVDLGQAWLDRSNKRYISSTPTRSGNNTSAATFLCGTGFGLRARLTRFLIGFVDVGFGLTNQDHVEPAHFGYPTARVHFGIRSDLLDNSFKKSEEATAPKAVKP